jgi:hypothetical protein
VNWRGSADGDLDPSAPVVAIAGLVLVTAAAALLATGGADAQDPVDRVAGENRWSTAGGLADQVDGDTLWVAMGFDVAAVADEAVQALSDAAGVADVARLAGGQRFETAAEVSADAHPAGADTAYVATGLAFADALTASAAAADADAPVLLAASDTLPQATADELGRLDSDEIVVVGGEAAVGPGVEAELGEHAGRRWSVRHRRCGLAAPRHRPRGGVRGHRRGLPRRVGRRPGGDQRRRSPAAGRPRPAARGHAHRAAAPRRPTRHDRRGRVRSLRGGGR